MSSTEKSQDSTGRRRIPLIASVAAVVLIAGGGGAYAALVGTAGDGGTDARKDTAAAPPPRLSVSPDGQMWRDIAPGEPDPGGGAVLRAAGKLPAGPERAAVHRPEGSVGAAEVTRLARALGMTGIPVSDGTAWTIGPDGDGTGPSLRVDVRAPGNWLHLAHGPAPAGDSCVRGGACPSDGDPAASGEGRPLGEKAAEKAAGPVLRALGQSTAALNAKLVTGSERVVNAEPVLGGLPTYGWTTSVRIGPDGRVTGGSGRLSPVAAGDEYPVLSAAAALKGLNSPERTRAPKPPECGTQAVKPPRVPAGAAGSPAPGDLRAGDDVPCPPPAPACASAVPLEERAEPGTSDPCAPAPPPSAPRPLEVTGAVFGLSSLQTDGGPVLVPSWLFRVAPEAGGESWTVAAPALPAEYLDRPAPSEPVPPSGEPETGGPSYRADGRKLSVTFWGGVCGEPVVTADESRSSEVRVRITEPEPEAGRVCVAMAKELTETVTLDRPLGSRKVVDAESGKPMERRAG
ncbi:hypothetical protein [Streptomyces sp. CAU 1734]|uniref:hypothetical protein n=1 Tax=Streptomyces sp. CAU 1734 TaxID=3140360 RepID=UPI00326158B6